MQILGGFPLFMGFPSSHAAGSRSEIFEESPLVAVHPFFDGSFKRRLAAVPVAVQQSRPDAWRQLYTDRSSRKSDSRRLFSRE